MNIEKILKTIFTIIAVILFCAVLYSYIFLINILLQSILYKSF